MPAEMKAGEQLSFLSVHIFLRSQVAYVTDITLALSRAAAHIHY
jgi:hypothetical protein